MPVTTKRAGDSDGQHAARSVKAKSGTDSAAAESAVDAFAGECTEGREDGQVDRSGII